MYKISESQRKLRKYMREILIELFSYGTPPFYGVNFSSAKTVLHELHDYCVCNIGTVYLKNEHIYNLVKEYLYWSSKDVIFSNYNKYLHTFNEFLKSSFLKQNSQENNLERDVNLLVARMEPILKIIDKTYLNNLEKYINRIFQKSEIVPTDFKKIKKACFLLATEILMRGYSRTFIFKSIQYRFSESTIYSFDMVRLIKNFLEIFTRPETSYNVYLKILTNNNEISQLFINKYGNADISCIDANKEPARSLVNIDNNDVIISKRIIALDPEGAIKIFTKEIYDFLDIINYEYPKYECSVFEYGFCDGVAKGLYKTIQSLDGYIKKSSVYFFEKRNTQIQNILSSDYIDTGSKEKIKTLLRFFRYSCDALLPEHKLLNLWIGWEHIFSFSKINNSSTFVNICRFFPKIYSMYYLERIFSDIIYTQFPRNNLPVDDLYKYISSDQQRKIPELYCILKNGGEVWNNFLSLSFLGDDDLTKVKLYRLKEKIKYPKNFINEQKDKTIWDLHRIYRTRNSIVHRGAIHNYNLPMEVLALELEQFYKYLLEIILDKFSSVEYFKNIEQLFVYLENTYDFLTSDSNHLSKLSNPVDVMNKIIRPTPVF